MNLKLIGAILVVAACASVGFGKAAAHRREEKLLRLLINNIEGMLRELKYRISSLPALCRGVGQESGSEISGIFLRLAEELERQIAPDAALCMQVVLEREGALPKSVHKHLLRLGECLGRFDLQGQIDSLEHVCRQCREDLDKLNVDRDTRLRGYQTLGLCAGFALAILLF